MIYDNCMEYGIDFDKIGTINVDLVVGLGEACRTAEALKRNHLRYFSSPFDWMIIYRLDKIINLLEKIANGCKPDFFAECSENINYAHGIYNGIVDTRNIMISMHDFPKHIDISKAPKFFYLKYKYRFQNLNKLLKRANKVCFLNYRKISVDEMKTFVASVKKIYTFKQIYFINIFDSDEEALEQYDDNGAKYLIFKFNDEPKNELEKATNPHYWLGNINYWDKILSKIKLNKKFVYLYKLKRFIFHISSECSSEEILNVISIFGMRFKVKNRL